MDDASFYQEHKDDGDEWGKPESARRPPSEKRKLAAMVSVRFTPEEESAVRAAAKSHQLSLSRFIRECALRDSGVRQVTPIAHLRQPTTGYGSSSAVSTTMVSGGLAITPLQVA